MYKAIIIILLGFLTTAALAQTNPAEQHAIKISQKMKDSIGISDQQKSSIYHISMQLFEQKKMVRQNYTDNNIVRVKIQELENTRDSLYRSVLTEEQFKLYRKNKREILVNK